MFLTYYWSYFHLFYLIRRFLRRFLPATFDMTDKDSTGNSSLVVWSIVYIFFRAISRTTSTFWVISQENVFENSLAEPENRIYHRWCTFHETNPADEKNNTVTGKHSLVYSNIARAKPGPKLKIQIHVKWVSDSEVTVSDSLTDSHSDTWFADTVSHWTGSQSNTLTQSRLKSRFSKDYKGLNF